ncbi:MAG: transporter substrate-binding domain-containing protein [Pseudomonadota bacterium]
MSCELACRCVLRLCLAFALLAPGACARAAETRLVVDDVAPFAFYEGGQLKGVSYELLRALAARLGHCGAVTLVPLARELDMLRRGPNAIGTLGRLKNGEHGLVWIAPRFDEQVLLVSTVGSGADIDSLAAARSLRVGVIRGGPASMLAADLGFRKVDTASTPHSNARKLALGRIDAWLTTWGVAAHAQQQIGKDVALLQRFPMFLVGSPGMAPAEIGRWRAALEAMKRDGSFQRILRAYHYD